MSNFTKTRMETVIRKIRSDLQDSIDEKIKKGHTRFFKEEIKVYGVKTARVKEIAKRYWTDVRTRSKKELFMLCEELFSSDYTEEAYICSAWLPRIADRFDPEDIHIFREWIVKYINNWAKCDSFCNHTVGDFMEKYPDKVSELKEWAASSNRWLRRASAVSLIVPAKKGMFVEDIFGICDILRDDPEDLVQKGYGWLLKETSKEHQGKVFDYVTRHKKTMPRTALRYAIERMPEDLRKQAMAKE